MFVLLSSLRRSPYRILLWLLVAMGIVVLWGRLVPQRNFFFRDTHEHAPSSGAPRSYGEALLRANQNLEGAKTLAATRSNEWLIDEKLATNYITRARLTGSFDDYAAARAALVQAFKFAEPNTGPHRTLAALEFSMHRLAATETALEAIDHYVNEPDEGLHTEAAAIRGDIAFYQGHYAEALQRYQAIGRIRGDQGVAFRVAVYQGKTGAVDDAIKGVEAMANAPLLPSAQMLANMALQRGGLELQRGNWDAATAQFVHADTIFPGYWLAQAHRAQMLALMGNRAAAIRIDEAIAKRGDFPEVTDALAGLYRAGGNAALSKIWADRAGETWGRRMAQFPEAAAGHATEHELAFGDPKRALTLAQIDFAARPYAGSAIRLGWALLANNRPADALRLMTLVLNSSWVSADQHLVAAQAYTLLGRSDEADAEQQKALAINPRATDPASALIWFGH
jgi:tetratricopeptide (TPR) repeat protein